MYAFLLCRSLEHLELLERLKPSNDSIRLFDHSIRSRQHVRRNRDSDLFGGFQIDDELKFRRLLDGEVRGLGTLQDLAHVHGGAAHACFIESPCQLWSKHSAELLS